MPHCIARPFQPRSPTAILLCAMWCLAVLPAFSQTNTGQITGVVRDASGGVLPGATVTAVHTASGTSLERTTDAQGRFYLPELRVGQWDVSATLSGFAPQTSKGVLLEIGRTVTMEFALGVQGLSEEVTVTG